MWAVNYAAPGVIIAGLGVTYYALMKKTTQLEQQNQDYTEYILHILEKSQDHSEQTPSLPTSIHRQLSLTLNNLDTSQSHNKESSSSTAVALRSRSLDLRRVSLSFLNLTPSSSNPGGNDTDFSNHSSWQEFQPITLTASNTYLKTQIEYFLRKSGHIEGLNVLSPSQRKFLKNSKTTHQEQESLQDNGGQKSPDRSPTSSISAFSTALVSASLNKNSEQTGRNMSARNSSFQIIFYRQDGRLCMRSEGQVKSLEHSSSCQRSTDLDRHKRELTVDSQLGDDGPYSDESTRDQPHQLPIDDDDVNTNSTPSSQDSSNYWDCDEELDTDRKRSSTITVIHNPSMLKCCFTNPHYNSDDCDSKTLIPLPPPRKVNLSKFPPLPNRPKIEKKTDESMMEIVPENENFSTTPPLLTTTSTMRSKSICIQNPMTALISRSDSSIKMTDRSRHEKDSQSSFDYLHLHELAVKDILKQFGKEYLYRYSDDPRQCRPLWRGVKGSSGRGKNLQYSVQRTQSFPDVLSSLEKDPRYGKRPLWHPPTKNGCPVDYERMVRCWLKEKLPDMTILTKDYPVRIIRIVIVCFFMTLLLCWLWRRTAIPILSNSVQTTSVKSSSWHW